MTRRLLTLLSAALLGLVTLVPITSAWAPAAQAAARADMDCGDFSSQAAAQNFFDNAGPGDPHNLDADGDGIACESNPCPCSTGGGGGGGGGGSTKPDPIRVIRVLTGDAVLVRLGSGARAKVKMIGVDAPDFGRPLECGARKSRQSARDLLPRGTVVRLIGDNRQANKDKQGRLLRYVVKRKKDVGWAQIARGYAKTDGWRFKRSDRYKSTQAAARRQDRALWSSCYR